MASMTASVVSSKPLCRPVSVQRPSARSVTVCATGKQEQKTQVSKLAQIAAAGLAAVFVAASPAFAADGADLKAKICASNPTSKICLRDSAKK